MSGNPQPFDFSEAKAAIRHVAQSQKDSEERLRKAWKDWAEKERVYRMALAAKMTTLKAEGVAWTVCGDLARGDKHVADLRYFRDVASGVKDAAGQEAFRHAADRRELEQLITWSLRVSPDGQYEESRR